ncbi:hypothetical protein GUITHDRAFT_105770 [Guillardia theta CCMP2712]|uniref:TRPM SLOG domain-containing protein n=1 Tax=Guillardia theta (strain CCMP2712) TaxID=905079 RepID=L1JJE8_GUITC|nr:hypothetical protein GUITHDRAFT_105770 [Guillardia theta CCMP2712]EKX48626.1 hypothetical protein GUITHDRAFT_105770 [Guillardia theta CCMP2712]|eukprot:XP_005835606.1 hypothetical protein GUITHDRAFT_105770 [Guillardia theta CCMP2712]
MDVCGERAGKGRDVVGSIGGYSQGSIMIRPKEMQAGIGFSEGNPYQQSPSSDKYPGVTGDICLHHPIWTDTASSGSNTSRDPEVRPESGTFEWCEHNLCSPAHFMVVSSDQVDETRFAQAVLEAMTRSEGWKSLTESGIIVSVTGGAKYFDLSFKHKELIMRDVVLGLKHLKPLVVTGGTHSGIMKYVGEARAKYEMSINLLGIVPQAVVKGSEVLTTSKTPNGKQEEKPIYNSFSVNSHSSFSVLQTNGPNKEMLDFNHSHFILVDKKINNGRLKDEERFGEETTFRANLESAIKDKANLQSPLIEGRSQTIPVISICVQGGEGSVKTLYDAIKANTPCLVVNGSGRAADLISDALRLRKQELQELHPRQVLLRECLQGQRSASNVMETLKQYHLVANLNTHSDALRLLDEVSAIAGSGSCCMFDLRAAHKEGDFKDAMLECILEHMSKSPSGGAGDLFHQRLSMAIKFQSPRVLSRLLRQGLEDLEIKGSFFASLEENFVEAFRHSSTQVIELLLAELPYLQFVNISWTTLEQALKDGSLEALSSLKRLNAILTAPPPPPPSKASPSTASGPAQRVSEKWEVKEPWFHSLNLRGYTSTLPLQGDFEKKWLITELITKQQLLEAHFKSICDSSFTYHLGADGPFADLFLSTIACDKVDLAVLIWRRWIPDVDKTGIFWAESMNPIIYAITAAFYFRKKSEGRHLNAAMKKLYQTTADNFEQKAIRVYQHAVDNDKAQKSSFGVASALNIRARIFRDKTLVDLAVLSDSDRFLETCCAPTIISSFHGDLATSTSFLSVLAGTIMFGIPAMFQGWGFLEFLGFEFHFKHEAQDFICKALQPVTQRFNHKEMRAVDRFFCFLASPIIIFVANGLQLLVLTVIFTIIVIPDYKYSMLADKLHWVEWVLLGHYISSIIRELIQLFLEGWREYFYSIWNILEIGAFVSYILGFLLHAHCTMDNNDCQEISFTADMIGHSTPYLSFRLCYCFSLFFTYLRLLQFVLAHKDIGILVWIIFKMFVDIIKFVFLYFIILLSLAVLMLGTTLPKALQDNCHVDMDQLDNYNFITCYPTWWIYRAMLLSWGDIHMEEMTNDASIGFLILTYVVLNVILLNLLIALMTDTYQAQTLLHVLPSSLDVGRRGCGAGPAGGGCWTFTASPRSIRGGEHDRICMLDVEHRIDLAFLTPLNIICSLVHIVAFFFNFRNITSQLAVLFRRTEQCTDLSAARILLDWQLSNFHTFQFFSSGMRNKGDEKVALAHFTMSTAEINELMTRHSLRVVTVEGTEDERKELLNFIAMMAEAKQKVCQGDEDCWTSE